MAYLDDDFSLVAASVERSARLQRAACSEALEDPASRGHGLAKHLDLAYDAVERRIAERRTLFAQAPDDAVKEDAIVEMRGLLWDVRKLQSNLSWLSAAQVPPLDLGTTYFVEDAARAFVAPRVEVTIVSTDYASYATSSDPWEPLIRAWGQGIPKSEPTVVVVFIPRREERSGLLHPLIIHELGHAADSQHGLVADIWRLAQSRKRLAKRFSDATTALANAGSLDPSDATDHVATRLRRWIGECLCDSIAIHHLGPTYLYSFLAEVTAGTMDEPGPRHPPARQRLRLMVEALDRLGWSDAMASGDAKVDAWVRATIATRPGYSAVDQFLTWAMDELQAVVRKTVEALLKDRVFKPVSDELGEVRELLESGIPPAQLWSGQACTREAVILAAWHAALESEGGGVAALADAPDAEELAKLLPAALELTALVRSWGSPE